MKYQITYSQYIGYEDKLSYLPENTTEGETLTLSPARLKTFLKKTGLVVRRVLRTGEPNLLALELINKPILHPSVLELMPPPIIAKHPIWTRRYDGRREGDFSAIVQQIVTPFVKKPIMFTVPHARAEPIPEDTEMFHVKVWSSPTDNAGRYITPPREMWEDRLGCRSEGFPASGEGLPLMHNDFCFGELHKNVLYISFDAVHEGTRADQRIMVRMLMQAMETYKATNWRTFNADREKLMAEAEERSLVQFARNSSDRAASRNRDALNKVESDVKALRKSLFDKEREAATLKLNEGGVDIQELVLSEFRKLKEGYANIQKASFNGSALTVITSPINSISANNNHHYHLGRVKIVIPFDNAGSIYMTDPDHGRRIPHTGCAERGQTCLGNVATDVASYMSNYEMLAAVSLMLAFLERGINTGDDWGRYLKNFPDLGAPE